MEKMLSVIVLVGATGLGATAASAQMPMPMGEELYNQTVQVGFANGTTNTVTFEPDGDMIIRAPGMNPVMGDWRVQGNQLCLYAQGDSECWAYNQRFQANYPITLTSSCDSQAQWLATSVSPVPQPPLPEIEPDRSGERG